MNICLNKSSIRVRISDTEFIQLKNTGNIQVNFPYWPLQVSIILQLETQISTIATNYLKINLAQSDADLLLAPDIKKSGLALLAKSANGDEITIDLQVDMHK